MWSSWIRVRCQTSQAIEFAPLSGRNASWPGVSPSTASCTVWLIRPKASASRSAMVISRLRSHQGMDVLVWCVRVSMSLICQTWRGGVSNVA